MQTIVNVITSSLETRNTPVKPSVSLLVLQPKMYVKEEMNRGIEEDDWIKFTVQKNASVWLQHLQHKSL